MKKDKNYPFDYKLTPYEQNIEDSFARGEWVSKLTPERRKELQEAAHRHVEARKSKSVTFRIKPNDLNNLKNQAKSNNIPYQTLLGLVINSYLQGKSKIGL